MERSQAGDQELVRSWSRTETLNGALRCKGRQRKKNQTEEYLAIVSPGRGRQQKEMHKQPIT
jgi:hypothetical protein